MLLIQRNLLRLLTAGSIGDSTTPIEPMSPWKWRQFHRLAVIHGVEALVYDGMAAHGSDFFMSLPPAQMSQWVEAVTRTEATNRSTNQGVVSLYHALRQEQLSPLLIGGQAHATHYPNPLHRVNSNIHIYFPTPEQAAKARAWAKAHAAHTYEPSKGQLHYEWQGSQVIHHSHAMQLTNTLLNRRLQSIIHSETHRTQPAYATIGTTIDIHTLPPTLTMLLAIARMATHTLSRGLSLHQLIDLAEMLRATGNAIDVRKLQQWISQLRLGAMAQLQGALLTKLLGINHEQIPFYSPQGSDHTGKTTRDLLLTAADSRHRGQWHFTQGNHVFVRSSNTPAMTWQLTHHARFFKLYPAEATTSLAAAIAHSMTHIEE